MSEDQLTLLTLDLQPIYDPLRSGAIFEHVQGSPPTFPTMPLHCRSLPLSIRSLPFNSRLFLIGPDFQIGLDRERIVAQWNGGIICITWDLFLCVGNLNQYTKCLCESFFIASFHFRFTTFNICFFFSWRDKFILINHKKSLSWFNLHTKYTYTYT